MMLVLNETVDQLAMASSVLYYGDMLSRGDHFLRVGIGV